MILVNNEELSVGERISFVFKINDIMYINENNIDSSFKVVIPESDPFLACDRCAFISYDSGCFLYRLLSRLPSYFASIGCRGGKNFIFKEISDVNS